MRHDDILNALQNLTKFKPTQQALADILGEKLGTIGARAIRNSQYSIEEVRKISEYYGVDLIGGSSTPKYTKEQIRKIEEIFNLSDEKIERKMIDAVTNDNGSCPYRMKENCPCKEQFEIKYIEELPKEARLPEITSVHVDRELVVNHWQRKPENLRIIPMQGDNLANYYYPCENRDILIVDIESKIPTREGLYVYSANDNTMIFVAKLSQLMDGTIKIEKFEATGEVTQKTVSPEKQQEVDFRVLGRVVKNCSRCL